MTATTSSHRMRIAVMTSGGDSGGMNAAVRSTVKMAIHRDCEVFLIREGYEGLVKGNDGNEDAGEGSPTAKETTTSTSAKSPFVPTYGHGELLREGVSEVGDLSLKGKYILRCGWDDVRGWMDEGGTLIGTARCLEMKERDGRLKAAFNLIKHGIDGLVVCGGDGSLTGADRLRNEWPSLVEELLKTSRITSEQAKRFGHLKVTGTVGSIDNDLVGVDTCIGSATALARICEMIDSISSTAASHSRAFVCVAMGRGAGHLSLQSGIATGADYVFVPEKPPKSDDWREEMCQVLKAHRAIGKRKTIVIVAEGAIDKNLNPINPEDVRICLEERLGLSARISILGHAQRGGKPVAEDRILATLQGVEAVNTLLEANPETPSYIIGIKKDKIVRLPLIEAVKETQQVGKYIESKQFEKAVQMRDPQFIEGLKTFDLMSKIDDSEKLPKGKNLRIAVIHVGAPAAGMNAATRMAVRYCHARGHTALLIANGFPGLISNQIHEPNWLQVDNWAIRGGSEIGTNRHLPSKDFQGVAKALEKQKVQGLVIIGGFEAFVSTKLMHEQRNNYKAFQIPIAHIPATLSGNIPKTEALGFSTSLNVVVNAADILKRSASASRRRVFLLSCQGGKAGQLAVYSALAAGAVLVYTPEHGVSLSQLETDLDWLRQRFNMDIESKSEGRMVIISDKASNAFNLEALGNIFEEESQGVYSVRSSSLGHLCQGGTPSPEDRCKAARLGRRACEFIESFALSADGSHSLSPNSAAVMCINGSSIEPISATELANESDFANRRGKVVPWTELKELVDLMAGRMLF